MTTAHDPLDPAGVGRAMHALATELFPICRSLTGPGFRETLDRLEVVTGPMTRHRFATGERVFDWTIPREWTIRDAWIKDPSGRTIVAFRDSNLHVLGYSAPVRARLPLEVLQQHLYSIPEQPDAIPYLTSYYEERWGFCLTHRQRATLAPGEYEVCIDADLAPGALVVGEVVIPGATDEEVLLSTYCCHPSLANNELSGPVLAAHLARCLRARGTPPRRTTRVLFLPETIGSIAWLSRFGARLRERLAAGYVVTCVGDPAGFTYKRSRRGTTLADRAAEHVLRHGETPSRVLDFFTGGSDERQYCSPGFDLPVGSLMRSVYGTYPQYHTSLDDLSFVTAEALGESFRAYWRILETLEANETFTVTMPWCEPQLGPRGLYPTLGSQRAVARRVEDMMALLNFCDGTVDLLAVADRIGRPIWALRPIVDDLVAHGLLRREPTG